MFPDVSRRGYYYNLDKSPYVHKSPYGDVFKFGSMKQLAIYRREVLQEIKKFDEYIKDVPLDNYYKETIRRVIYGYVYNERVK